jgi:hypothetical protein
MPPNRRTRFLIAVGVSVLALLLAVHRLFGSQVYTPGAYGNWIPVYLHPLEVMLITALMLGVCSKPSPRSTRRNAFNCWSI